MTVEFGINVTQNGSDRLEGQLGPWARIVVSDDRAAQIVRNYQAGGRRVIAVATRQVIMDLGNDQYRTPERFFTLFQHADAVQVWNEPDGGGDESDVASKETYQIWLWAFRDEAHRRGWTKPLVAAGLVSGNPTWLDGIDMSGGYKLALHPYDQKPYAGYPDWGHGDLGSLLGAYTPYLPAGTKFWLTECSRTTPIEDVQARYAQAFVQTVAQRHDVDVCLWYCWKDWHLGSVPRPFGLRREDGSAKPTYYSYTSAVIAAQNGGDMASVKNIDEAQAQVWKLADPNTPFNPDSAIYKYWIKLKQNGRAVGVPIGAEMSFPADEPKGRKAAQGLTSGFLLVWYGGEDVRVE